MFSAPSGTATKYPSKNVRLTTLPSTRSVVPLPNVMSIVTPTTPRFGSKSKELTDCSSSPLPALCAVTRSAGATSATVVAPITTTSKQHHLSIRRIAPVSSPRLTRTRQSVSSVVGMVVERGVDPRTPRFSGRIEGIPVESCGIRRRVLETKHQVDRLLRTRAASPGMLWKIPDADKKRTSSTV